MEGVVAMSEMAEAGTMVVEVEAWCSECGISARWSVEVAVSEWTCLGCGSEQHIDRTQYAAEVEW